MIINGISWVKLVVIATIAIFVFSVTGWWIYIYNKPSAVFDRMLDTVLSSPSVTKTIIQDQEGQKLKQIVQLTSQPSQQVHSTNVLDQGQDSAVITTESFSTRSNDFVRYSDIKTEQKNTSGNDFDFSSVLGVWGKSGNNPQTGEQAQLFDQTMLGVVPVGNLPRFERRALVEQIKRDNVYKVDYSKKIDKKFTNGRFEYEYTVSLQPVAYINMLKKFSGHFSISTLDNIDPEQYANTEALDFKFSVDILSGQLTKITYAGGTRTEEFGSYGARVVIPEPTESISIEELQSNLEKLQ